MTRSTSKTGISLGTLFAALLLATSARAESPAERASEASARHEMDEGDHFVEQQQLDKALASYKAAHAILHAPTSGIEVALTLAALGRWVEAREAALEVTNLPGAGNESSIFAEARKNATDFALQLADKIPSLRLELPDGVEPSSLHATIDGQPLAEGAISATKRLDPGTHVVRVESSGYQPFVREVQLTESVRSVVNVELRVAHRILGLPPFAFGGLLVAAGGIAAGTVTAVKAVDEKGSASTTFAWISAGSFALALAGGAVATYSLITKTDRVTQRGVGLRVTPTGLSLDGTF